jgi:hypothetical protein
VGVKSGKFGSPRATVPPTVALALLGHEPLATTQKYLEPSKETEKELEAMKLPF